MSETFQELDLGFDVTDLHDSCIIKGMIVDVDTSTDTAQVDFGDLGVIDDVPIHYHCEQSEDVTKGSTAFLAGDAIFALAVNMRTPEKANSYTVLGHQDGPVPCQGELFYFELSIGFYFVRFFWDILRQTLFDTTEYGFSNPHIGLYSDTTEHDLSYNFVEDEDIFVLFQSPDFDLWDFDNCDPAQPDEGCVAGDTVDNSVDGSACGFESITNRWYCTSDAYGNEKTYGYEKGLIYCYKMLSMNGPVDPETSERTAIDDHELFRFASRGESETIYSRVQGDESSEYPGCYDWYRTTDTGRQGDLFSPLHATENIGEEGWWLGEAAAIHKEEEELVVGETTYGCTMELTTVEDTCTGACGGWFDVVGMISFESLAHIEIVGDGPNTSVMMVADQKGYIEGINIIEDMERTEDIQDFEDFVVQTIHEVYAMEENCDGTDCVDSGVIMDNRILKFRYLTEG